MKQNIALIAALVFGPLSGLHAQSPNDDISRRFVGAWHLISWTQRLSDGTTRQNPISVASIIYTDTGHMCSVGMNPNRPRWKSTAPTPEEALSGINGMYAYCASVEIHPREGFVIHHVEMDKSPEMVGKDRKRWFTFDGPNRVALRIDPKELTGNVVESILTWERLTK